jgi:hypothetical protein
MPRVGEALYMVAVSNDLDGPHFFREQDEVAASIRAGVGRGKE